VLLLCGRQHDRFTAIDACGAPCPVTFPQKDFERVRGRSKAIRFHGIGAGTSIVVLRAAKSQQKQHSS
jgi:hypothetical protein